MTFSSANNGGGSGSDANKPPKPEQEETPKGEDEMPPGEGAPAAPIEEPLAKPAAPAEEPEAPAVDVAELQRQLDQANARIAQFEAEQSQRAAEAIDAELAEYEIPEAALPIIRETFLSDRAKGEALISAFAKKAPPAPPAPPASAAPTEEPPAPIHDTTGDEPEMKPEEKVKEQRELIKSIQAEGKFTDYTSAREQARRQKPELFT